MNGIGSLSSTTTNSFFQRRLALVTSVQWCQGDLVPESTLQVEPTPRGSFPLNGSSSCWQVAMEPCLLRHSGFSCQCQMEDLFWGDEWGGEGIKVTSCFSCLSFIEFLMRGSHTVNHLRCDHFQVAMNVECLWLSSFQQIPIGKFSRLYIC